MYNNKQNDIYNNNSMHFLKTKNNRLFSKATAVILRVAKAGQISIYDSSPKICGKDPKNCGRKLINTVVAGSENPLQSEDSINLIPDQNAR